MEKRVVVTGLGAITPLGNDVKTTWNNMKAGVCGIDTVTKFDISEYKCTLAAEVHGSIPRCICPRAKCARTDLYTQYAVAAATQAYEDSGMTAESVAPDRFGVYIGSGIGGIQTLITEHTKLIEKGTDEDLSLFRADDDLQHRVGHGGHQIQRAGAEHRHRHRLRHLYKQHRRGIPRHPSRLCGRHARGAAARPPSPRSALRDLSAVRRFLRARIKTARLSRSTRSAQALSWAKAAPWSCWKSTNTP